MLGLGFIPLFMAYEYIKNREKYCREYRIIAIIYLLCLPVVYYDALFYKDFGVFNWVLSDGLLPWIYLRIIVITGMFLLIKGLQVIGSGLYEKFIQKEGDAKDAVD